MKIHFLILALTLFCANNTAFAQWQWLDKDGHKVFSDRAPPPDIAEKSIVKRPNALGKSTPQNDDAAKDATAVPGGLAASAPVRPIVGGIDKDLEAKKKQAADAELAKRRSAEEANNKIRVENCARAKQAKATFESGVRVSRTNANGEREIMDDAARAAELKRIQGAIDSECK